MKTHLASRVPPEPITAVLIVVKLNHHADH
jgi:hypothetical protein